MLSGGTPQANFKHFCHAWGRDATFVSRLSNFICERRGDSDRKKIRPSDVRGISKKPLKKTGVIIPRTTPLEIYRNGTADTDADAVDAAQSLSDIVEQAVDTAAIVAAPTTIDTTVDDVEMDVIITTNSNENDDDDNDNHPMLDAGMLDNSHDDSESFLLLDESTDGGTNHPLHPEDDHPELTQV